MNPERHVPRQSSQLAGRSLSEWNSAYTKVEAYFLLLQVQNKPMLGQLVSQVLERAMRRAPEELHSSATELAADEMDRLVSEWFALVLGEPPVDADHRLSARGRLALLLADMPDRWQDQFLSPGPWPEEFLTAMREAYLQAGPDFQLAKMAPRPLELGPIATLVELGQMRYAPMVTVWFLFALLLMGLFILTH